MLNVLAGTPFMEMNDVSIRPARHQVTPGDGTVYEYGASGRLQSHHSIRRASVLRAPNKSTTIWPGDFLKIEVLNANYDNTYAIEPRFDTSCPQSTSSALWPSLALISSVAHRIRIPNLTQEPQFVKRNSHTASLFPTFHPSEYDVRDETHMRTVKTQQVKPVQMIHSTAIQVDPDHTFPPTLKERFISLHAEHDEVFDLAFKGYNGFLGPFQAVVNMSPTQPPQRKGRLPQYARNRLVELQEKFDELEALGVFKRPEEVNVNVEYLNPSFLVKKPSGGSRLVTAFADVGRYSKPQPSLLPDVDSTLRQIGQWRYIIATDLAKAFYQIPLSKDSMKYCGWLPHSMESEFMSEAPWVCLAVRPP